MNLPNQMQLQTIYGESRNSRARFQRLVECFLRTYHREDAEFFTAPGRTEIIGNHTDHNGGKVIAGSIQMDTIGAAFPNGSDIIRITSEGYRREIVIDLSRLGEIPKAAGTEALVAGMMEGTRKYGFRVSGFDAYVATNVIPAAGVSSSASFEMLICAVVNYFFNDDTMTYIDYARIGKYAENVYWKKSSGMMDQMACAFGGTVLLNFSDKIRPDCRRLHFSFDQSGYQLVIVNTGKGHADLSHEYSEIPAEMGEAAKVLGVDLLWESTIEDLIECCPDIPNDRSILRALHFFDENERVNQAADAIADGNIARVLRLIEESGTSSWELLQNCYSLQDYKEQRIPLLLALSKRFLKTIGDGVCRVHGGGFAGVIMCVIPKDEADNYIRYISKYAGRDNVYPMHIREIGAVHISDRELAR